MGMKLLAFHDQSAPDLASNDKQHNFQSLDIIQHAEVADTQLKFSEGIGAQPLKRSGQPHRLMEETCPDR
jgi:hypothetical protein